MRSDQQTDWMRDDPQRLAKVWREAGDAADRIEREARERKHGLQD